MIKLYDALITDILPISLGSSDEVKALAYSLRMAMRLVMDFMASASVYYNIELLPDPILDELAAELRVPYYDSSVARAIKIQQLKGSLAWYTKAGTSQGVIDAIEAIYGTTELSEWYEYEGEPYHFRLLISTDAHISEEDKYKLAHDQIFYYKNVRSVLDAIEYVIQSVTARNYVDMRNVAYSAKASCTTINSVNI